MRDITVSLTHFSLPGRHYKTQEASDCPSACGLFKHQIPMGSAPLMGLLVVLRLLVLASSAQAFSKVQCAMKGGGGVGRSCCPSVLHQFPGFSVAQLSPLALTHCPGSVLALSSVLGPPTLFHMFPHVPVVGVSGNRASGTSPPFWATASPHLWNTGLWDLWPGGRLLFTQL